MSSHLPSAPSPGYLPFHMHGQAIEPLGTGRNTGRILWVPAVRP